MTIVKNLPSYEELFGALDFKKGDAARTVYSPAAYLADLLQLIDDVFENADLHARRPDIDGVPLDGEHTFTPLPYLDIVNELLERAAADGDRDAWAVLRDALYPFNQPFDLDTARLHNHLHFHNVAPETLHRLFRRGEDPDRIARDVLQLSEEAVRMVVREATVDEDYLRRYFHLEPGDIALRAVPVAVFLRATGLSGAGLRELLSGNLSGTAVNGQGRVETERAAELFINAGLGGYARLDEREEHIVWSDARMNIPGPWFDRVNRLVRLSGFAGIAVTDLDRVLRLCCGNRLDGNALQVLAVLRRLRERFELDLDVLCALLGPIDAMGIGNDGDPADLFNRIFNARFATVSGRVLSPHPGNGAAAWMPRAWADLPVLRVEGDLLAIESKDLRRRIAQALGIAEKQLIAIVERYRAHTPTSGAPTALLDEGAPVDLPALSLLYRIVMLTEMLEMDPADLFHLLDALERDPSLRRFGAFDLLIDTHPDDRDGFRILAGGDVPALMWLVQTVTAMSGWMQRGDLAAADLRFIASGAHPDAKAAESAQARQLAFLNGLYQQFRAVMLDAAALQSGPFDARGARLLHRAVTAEAAGLVYAGDARLLRYDPAACDAATRAALARLDAVHPDDFTGLGIADRMLDKLVTNLIFRGVIDAEGRIRPEAVPAEAADFRLAGDFRAHRETLFGIIHDRYRDAGGDGGGDDLLEFAVYESDLEGLDLSAAATGELYDNLIFNGYLDDEGTVLDTAFFADPANAARMAVNAALNGYGDAVHALIAGRMARFEREVLTVSRDGFADLAAQDLHVDDLLENLVFNGYLTDTGAIADKQAVLALTARDMDLALEFYPHRHAILDVLQGVVTAFRERLFVLSNDDLVPIAEAIVSRMVYDALEGPYTREGRFLPGKADLFRTREHLADFHPGPYFDDPARAAVFAAITGFLTAADPLQLTTSDLVDLGMDTADAADLRDFLLAQDFIDERGGIPESRMAYFLTVNNALDFYADGFADFSKDLFFILHGIARESDARRASARTMLGDLAARQEETLFAALQEHFEIGADVLRVICAHVFRGTPGMVGEWLLPVLSAVDGDDRIPAVPVNNRFGFGYRRVGQFARLAGLLRLDARETAVAFRDQSLAEKFPEKLTLPEGVDGFDALLELTVDAELAGGEEGADPVAAVCIFRGERFWIYSAEAYALLRGDVALVQLDAAFAGIERVDAAFTDEAGAAWLIAGTRYFRRERHGAPWEAREKSLGRVNSGFGDPDHIDAAFTDSEGKTYLFAGEQYVRYSAGYEQVDEGYPKRIAGNWIRELDFDLPDGFASGVDAAVQDDDGATFLFRGTDYLSSVEPGSIRDIRETWGRVRSNFGEGARIDAAFVKGPRLYILSGDQMVSYVDSIENENARIEEGTLRGLGELPDGFREGVDAAMHGFDGVTRLFRGGRFISAGDDRVFSEPEPVTRRWGRVRNLLQASGTVEAAFTGLDGRTYLFSGDQYVRYSGTRYTHVDEGYPRAIAGDWGGLERVDAAFVLDGKTYLFGRYRDNENEGSLADGYVRYSTRDYATPDAGYPRAADDNWWNLPEALVSAGFTKPDSVLVGPDGTVYLFAGSRFVRFDAQHRWWSEPEKLSERWDSIPFDRVEAAFTGKDGRTYLFAGGKYIRYSDGDFSRIDDRFPKKTASDWGVVDNALARTGTVDAALTLRSREPVDDGDGVRETLDTYLFCGTQYVRYATAPDYDWSNGYPEYVDEGYPKAIATGLKNEPRFRNLTVSLSGGIEAAVADRRTVYLFAGGQCHAVSEDLYRENPSPLTEPLGSALLDGGSLFLASQGVWRKVGDPDGAAEVLEERMPPILREVSESFRLGVDAVLPGADGITHVFKDGQCWNGLLKRSYPLNEEWGRVRNTIALEKRVDAAFTGRDGRVYLFRGDQFVRYAAAGAVIPDMADGLPMAIAEHWGGLTAVHAAFVRDGKTFLVEPPDGEGRFRYVCYSGSDYGAPDAGYPKAADFSWWEIPDPYVADGFDGVDAVLVDGERTFLIQGARFIQHDRGTDQWTYPRPLERAWRGLPVNDERFEAVEAAFTGPDGAVYFFCGGHYVRHHGGGAGAIEPVAARWAVLDNHIATRNRIDAAFRHPAGATYLFSGDQFVRYSSDDYRFVDAGYPKSTVAHLREEAPFANLSDAAMAALADLFAGGGGIDAVTGNGRTVHVFAGGAVHTVSQSLTGTVPVARLGRLRNTIAESGRIDAALHHEGALLLFSGDQYVRYSSGDHRFVDEGYPKRIAANADGLPALERVDALFRGTDAVLYLFHGREFTALADGGDPVTEPVAGRWGVVGNRFLSDAGNVPVDAAFVAPGGGFYVFKDDQYIRYAHSENDVVDEGYPKAIRDNWGDLPVDYEAGISGGFVFDGKTFLLKRHVEDEGEAVRYDYVRYTDPSYRAIDAIYPQPFALRWGPWNDYLISDIHAISRFKRLQDEYRGDGITLSDFLDDAAGDKKTPYAHLSELFGWDVDEVKWLKRRNAFLTAENPFEVEVDLERVLKMHAVFTVTDKMGSSPSDLYETVWRPLYERGESAAAADRLYAFLGLVNSAADWKILERQIHDEMNVIKRDALMPFVLDKLGLENSRDLYEVLLIDPEMSSCGETSRVKEAITAVQLYLHRFFVNLEQIEISGEVDDVKRRQLKRWWQWMKNYRVWEANRKVFLYPENYIRPELRDTKTPAFQTLEEDLLQGEINDASVTRAYKKYLDHYTEVSRLKIAGGYVYDDTDSAYQKRLILFGHTKTDPRQYFYRTAAFIGGDTNAATWEPWREVNIQIDATKVYPVFAFGRVFVFWATVEVEVLDVESGKMRTVEKDGATEITSETVVIHTLRVWFSFYNLNKEWIPPQSLDTQINPDAGDGEGEMDESDIRALQMRETAPITRFKLFVENSEKLENHAHENIVINCSYVAGGRSRNRAYVLTPELYSKTTERPDFSNAGITVFRTLFDPREVITESRVVFLNTYENSTDGPWYSFDHKGGSFLVKPAVPGLSQENEVREFTDRFPAWDHIDAAVQAPDGSVYYFRNDTMRFVSGADVSKEADIAGRWGIVRNAVFEHNKVDGALHDPARDRTWLFRNGEYITYAGSRYDFALDIGPRPVLGNEEGFPQWPRIDGAFKGGDGRFYYFDNDARYFATSDNPELAIATASRWGILRNVFTDPATAAVTAAVEIDGKAWLANGADFIRYSDAADVFVDSGFPKAGGVKGLLEELGFAEVSGDYANMPIDAAWVNDGVLMLYSSQGNTLLACDLSEKTVAVQEYGGPGIGAAYVNGDGQVQILESNQYSAAFVAGGKFYLFKGDAYMRSNTIPTGFDQVTWRATGKIADAWGKERTNIAADGVVDAAFQDGKTTWLFSGNEYYRYTGARRGEIGSFVDAGFPKKLSTNRDGFPKWTRMSAAFRGGNGRTYFFNNAAKTYATSDAPDQEAAIISRWGRIRTNVVEKGVDAAYVADGALFLISGNEYVRYTPGGEGELPGFIDAGYPKPVAIPAPTHFNRVSAAFAHGDSLYLIDGDMFLRCPAARPYVVMPGYPKAGRLGALLIDLGFESVAGAWANLQVHGAYAKGNDLYVHSHGYTLRCSLSQKSITPLDNSRNYFEAAYVNASGEVQKLRNESYDAAVVVDGVFYLFKGDEYMRSERIPESFDGDVLQWAPSGKIRDKWTDSTAAVSLNDAVYLFLQGNYARLPAGSAPDALSGVAPITGNWGNLHAEFKSGFDAALRTSEAVEGRERREEKLYLFKGNRFVEYRLEKGKARPYEIGSAEFDIIRLTTSTGYLLNQRLFAGGIEALLSLTSQEIDEVPGFSVEVSTPTTIKYVDAKVNQVPVSSHLDFFSANGLYYWEVFFHAPFLIARAFSTGQKFKEAKRWYEFIYDPTERSQYWSFLPFLSVDIEALIASGRDSIAQLEKLNVSMAEVKPVFERVFTRLAPIAPVFLGERDLSEAERAWLGSRELRDEMVLARGKLAAVRREGQASRIHQLIDGLGDISHMVEMLLYRHDLLQTSDDQIQKYQDDPFDPHAIAGLRRIAYRKAIVMTYVDNLLEWGDMLFRQYSVESISEARMLYILAYDLLGRRPESLGTRILSETRFWGGPGEADGLYNPGSGYDFLLDLEQAVQPPATRLSFAATIHDSVANNAYFFIPENEVFVDYWERVEDRLHKIRHCLNIMGVKQPLPLFQPPIDPMAVVQAVGAGAALGDVLAGLGVAIPHYRFTFMVNKSRELVQKLSQFGGELLQALEKKDAEELSLLQNRQEGIIMAMSREVREAQLEEVRASIASLRESHRNAQARTQHFDGLINAGMNPLEISQLSLMAAGAASQYAAVVLKALAGLSYLIPEMTVGLFSFGAKTGGIHAGNALVGVSDGVQTLGEALSMTGEALGVAAQFERMKEDWELQKIVAQSEVRQIEAQIRGAEWQEKAAKREIDLLEKEIDHNADITTFMKEKFTNQQLYQWMTGKLSGIYFQTYKMAHDMARYAEQAFRYERGVPESEASFIQPAYWDSQRKGLLAGDSLGVDIDRMEKAFIESNRRRLEISRNISLLGLDPLALLQLKTRGECEFRLPESLFDYDYQGHYCRQIKTISLSFDMGSGEQVMATLTQLGHHTVMEPDPKAVKYLLNPDGTPPLSIRSDWRAHQQIALSHIDDYEKNNGLFELRFDDDRYLPFEGTGAVSNWRLTLNGKKGSYNVKQLNDVVINLKFTALQGGAAFATAVKGLLKPYQTAIFFDMAREFPTEWNAFISDGADLRVTMTREMFPNMSSSKIAGIFSQFDHGGERAPTMVLNGDSDLTLKDNAFLDTSGLSIAGRGSEWTLALSGDRSVLNTVNLVIIYKAAVS